MRKAVLIAVTLVVMNLPVFAGTYLMNDTGQTVYGLQVTFSEPVRITGFGDALTSVNSTGESTEFTFSGGQVSASAGQWFNWQPATAQLLSYEWIRSKVELSALGVGGIRVETNPRTESPIVSGVLLNPLYFTHGACVMQGVDDLDKIFAMPLLGVEELSFWPTAEGIDPATVTWTIEEITEPQGISAEIQNDTLYIWGSDPSWAGYGEVTLSATAAGGASGTVTIPVTVFRDDRTLVNNKGKKEYYIPWGVELDINRIVSVEEHMRQYDKEDLGLLDRTLRFSRYKVMEELRDVDLSTQWFIEGGDHSWPNTPSLL